MTRNDGPVSLPPTREIAEDLRDGEDLDTLAKRYRTSRRMLLDRLRLAGYAPTGRSLQAEARLTARLEGSVEGSCITGVGGGDWTDLPLEPPRRDRAPRRRFVGLDWSTSPATLRSEWSS